MSWHTLRDAMAVVIDAIPDLKGLPTIPVKQGEPNVAIIWPGSPLLQNTGHGGLVQVNFRVAVVCRGQNLDDAQDRLDAYVWPTGTNSIIAAVLNTAALNMIFDSVDDYGPFEDSSAFMANILFHTVTES